MNDLVYIAIMYTPPFSIGEDELRLLGEISALLPCASGDSAGVRLTEAELLQAHARLGGDACYRSEGSNPHWVPVLVAGLLEWLKQSPVHPVIRAAVFCHELLCIAPFAAGNEILTCALHRQLLAACHPELGNVQFTPEMKHALTAINGTELISASLHAILAVLRRKSPAPRPARHSSTPVEQLVSFIRRHPGSKRQDIMAALPGISPRMLDRHLQTLRESGRIEYRGSRKTGAYFIL